MVKFASSRVQFLTNRSCASPSNNLIRAKTGLKPQRPLDKKIDALQGAVNKVFILKAKF